MITKQESKSTKSKTNTGKRVAFTLTGPEVQKVFLAGDFNSWDEKSHPLKRNSSGTWKINIDLMPGRYEYRFLVAGEWQNDLNCTNFVPNPYGNENCVLRVK